MTTADVTAAGLAASLISTSSHRRKMSFPITVTTARFPSVPTWAAAAAALLLAGCSMNPVKVTPDEIAERVRNDQAQMYKDQVPVSGASP